MSFVNFVRNSSSLLGRNIYRRIDTSSGNIRSLSPRGYTKSSIISLYPVLWQFTPRKLQQFFSKGSGRFLQSVFAVIQFLITRITGSFIPRLNCNTFSRPVKPNDTRSNSSRFCHNLITNNSTFLAYAHLNSASQSSVQLCQRSLKVFDYYFTPCLKPLLWQFAAMKFRIIAFDRKFVSKEGV